MDIIVRAEELSWQRAKIRLKLEYFSLSQVKETRFV